MWYNCHPLTVCMYTQSGLCSWSGDSDDRPQAEDQTDHWRGGHSSKGQPLSLLLTHTNTHTHVRIYMYSVHVHTHTHTHSCLILTKLCQALPHGIMEIY